MVDDERLANDKPGIQGLASVCCNAVLEYHWLPGAKAFHQFYGYCTARILPSALCVDYSAVLKWIEVDRLRNIRRIIRVLDGISLPEYSGVVALLEYEQWLIDTNRATSFVEVNFYYVVGGV